MKNSSSPPGLWVGQLLHVACLVPLVVLMWVAWRYQGRPFPVVFWAAVAIPVLHQVFMWLAWRLELRSSAISGKIGVHAYLVVFFLLLVGRVTAVLALAWMDRGSLGVAVLPRVVTTIVLCSIWVYLGYSLKRYFGFVRAAGADHFDPRYREMPLVREGIFRFTSNAMYVYGFLILWAIAIGFDSLAALMVTVFNHAYIWVHFYATEKPDMDYLHSATRPFPPRGQRSDN